jgi:uncharacterized membrane protein required for colicin V production
MVSQIVSAGSFFVCWLVSSRFGGLVAPTIPVESPWNQVAAMAVIFLITMVAIRFAYALLEKLIRHWHLAKLNSLLGGMLGFLKGFLICMILTFFAVMFSETSRGVVFNSVSGLYLIKAIAGMSFFVPKDSYEFVHAQLDQFQQKVDAAVPNQELPELKIQGTETVQQFLNQVQQIQASTQIRTGSLWTAVTDWWNGKKAAAGELTAKQTVQEPVSPAAAPALQNAVKNTVQETVQKTAERIQNEIFPPDNRGTPAPVTDVLSLPLKDLPPPVVQKSAEIDDLFRARTTPDILQPLVPGRAEPLTPLEELSVLPPANSLPQPVFDRRTDSDALLRNSSLQIPKPELPAKLFRR